MSCFYSAVTEQKVFICAVYAFIGKLLRAVLPEVAWNNTCLPSDEDFGGIIDAVIQKYDPSTAFEGDCCIAMAQTACRQMKRVCELLRNVCRSLGLKDEADQYLDAPWFVDLLLRKNVAKLNKLYYTIDFDDEKPSRILMNVAAILNDKAVAYDAMSARAKRKADRETKELIKEATSRIEKKIDAHSAEAKKQLAAVREEIHETKEELLARADEIIKKLGKVNLDGKRNRSHTPAQRKVALACWLMAKDDLKDSTSGVVTKRMAFERYCRVLEDVGIKTFAKFDAVIRSIRNQEYEARKRALEAKQEAARKAKSDKGKQPSKKCDIIRHMKKRAIRAIVGTALSIFAVVASPLRSDASANASRGGGAPLLRRAS